MKSLLKNIANMRELELISLKESIFISDGNLEDKEHILVVIDDKLGIKKKDLGLVEHSKLRAGEIE